MSQTTHEQDGTESWTLYAPDRDTAKHFQDRADAEAKRDELSDLMDIEMFPPGELPDALAAIETSSDDGDSEDSSTVPCEECDEPVTPSEATYGPHNEPYHEACHDGTDGDDSEGEPVEAEVVETNPEPQPTEPATELDERTLSEDPLNWVPQHFVDEIEGIPVINRKGYAVIAEHYDISVTAEVVTSPGDTDFQYAEFRATATTPDGTEYSGWGSAHVDRGDDKTLLAELAETRAMKRATAWATGVGMTAMEELRSEVQE